MIHFRMCNNLQFTQNSLVLIPYLLTYSQQCFVTTLLSLHILFMRNVFCFNGFNLFMWFNMGRITKDDRCLTKTFKTENITLFDWSRAVSSPFSPFIITSLSLSLITASEMTYIVSGGALNFTHSLTLSLIYNSFPLLLGLSTRTAFIELLRYFFSVFVLTFYYAAIL